MATTTKANSRTTPKTSAALGRELRRLLPQLERRQPVDAKAGDYRAKGKLTAIDRMEDVLVAWANSDGKVY